MLGQCFRRRPQVTAATKPKEMNGDVDLRSLIPKRRLRRNLTFMDFCSQKRHLMTWGVSQSGTSEFQELDHKLTIHIARPKQQMWIRTKSTGKLVGPYFELIKAAKCWEKRVPFNWIEILSTEFFVLKCYQPFILCIFIFVESKRAAWKKH